MESVEKNLQKRRQLLVTEKGLRVLWNETCPQLLHFGKAGKNPVSK